MTDDHADLLVHLAEWMSREHQQTLRTLASEARARAYFHGRVIDGTATVERVMVAMLSRGLRRLCRKHADGNSIEGLCIRYALAQIKRHEWRRMARAILVSFDKSRLLKVNTTP